MPGGQPGGGGGMGAIGIDSYIIVSCNAETKYRVRTSLEIQKSRVFQGCFTVFSRAFPGFLEVQNENNIHNEL